MYLHDQEMALLHERVSRFLFSLTFHLFRLVLIHLLCSAVMVVVGQISQLPHLYLTVCFVVTFLLIFISVSSYICDR